MMPFNCATQRHKHIEMHTFKCLNWEMDGSDGSKAKRHCISRCKDPVKRAAGDQTRDCNLLKISVATVFTDVAGLLVDLIPGFPFQATCSISTYKNTTEKLKFTIFIIFSLNQNTRKATLNAHLEGNTRRTI